MNRDVRFAPHGARDFRRLDDDEANRLNDALKRFAETGHGDVLRLQGRRGEWRLRVGDWRAMFFYDQDGGIVVTRVVRRNEGTYRR